MEFPVIILLNPFLDIHRTIDHLNLLGTKFITNETTT